MDLGIGSSSWIIQVGSHVLTGVTWVLKRWKREAGRSQEDRLEDATPVALKMAVGPLGAGREGTQPCPHFDFHPVRPILESCKIIKQIYFGVICYSGI